MASRTAQVHGRNLRIRFCLLRGSHVDDVHANLAENPSDPADDGTPSRDLSQGLHFNSASANIGNIAPILLVVH